MEKIIGKLLCAISLLSFGVVEAADPTITVRLLSQDGEAIEYVAVGEPFRVEVVMEGMGQAPKNLTIPGLDKINARRNGYYLTTINGVSSIKFNFQAQIDKPAVIPIGPVTVMHDDKEIKSNKLRVIAKVDDSTTIQRKQKKDEIDAFLRFFVDKKDAVVGEKIVAKLRFYSRGQDIQVRQLNNRELPSFTMTTLEGPTQGQEIINGNTYQYAEWRWNLFPKDEGKLVIPAYSIDYDQVMQRSSQWSFLSLFGTRMETKRVHSNAQVINVKPLPPHKGQLFLVGNVTEVTAELTPNTIKIGDAAILSIDIEGEGNIEGIEKIELRGMPDSLKYYDSKTVMVSNGKSGKLERKRFEFIVQGLKEGNWEIPAQTFSYYNVSQKAYEEKSTIPLQITIDPGALPNTPLDVQTLTDKESELTATDLGPINTKSPWNGTSAQRSLPWLLFFLLALLPILLFVGAFAWGIIYHWYLQRVRYSFAYKRAHEQLVIAQKNKDSRRIYYIMKAVIADRKKIPIDQISPEIIHQILKTMGMSEHKLIEWDKFSIALQQQVFAYHDHKPELFAQAHQWLNEWEGLL